MGAQTPRFTAPTVTVATRLTETERRLLDWLTAVSGTDSPAGYLRDLLRAHFRDLGFDPTSEPGALRLPTPEQVAVWRRELEGCGPIAD